jgi:hypothetical protein
VVWRQDPKQDFLILYGIACAKKASVAVQLEISGGSNQWNVSFARAAHVEKLMPHSTVCCIQLE